MMVLKRHICLAIPRDRLGNLFRSAVAAYEGQLLTKNFFIRVEERNEVP